jgi:alkyl sulfatase BDS1-like metallo-beta-lactamase superfamily hydrolase
MTDQLRELAEQHWRGGADLVRSEHPVFAHFDGGRAQELGDHILYLKLEASVTAVDGGDGLALLDTAGRRDADHVYDQVRAWRTDAPLRAVVYSHHHIDHVFGVRRFDEEADERGIVRPTVYAQANVRAHFDRYERTQSWNARINARQVRRPDFEFPSGFRRPDVTFGRDLTVRLGDLTLELHAARGETDDCVWTYVPELQLLHPGDLFIWALPNAGNPQKVQRYSSDWAAALRAMAAVGAETMIPGHGLPIFGADRISSALLDTAELLDELERQTLELMNAGATLDAILQSVAVPSHLSDKPYLQAVYDHPQFVVRNVWRRYGGWWDGEPDGLLPAPRAKQATEWVALAGGTDHVVARARELAAAGELQLACHLVEAAVLAEPSTDAHAARAEIYSARAAGEDCFMARNILEHAAESSRQGRRDLVGPA